MIKQEEFDKMLMDDHEELVVSAEDYRAIQTWEGFVAKANSYGEYKGHRLFPETS